MRHPAAIQEIPLRRYNARCRARDAARLDYFALLPVWIADRPQVQAWWQRAQSRPSFRSAIPEALSAREIEEMHVSGAKIRAGVAEKRAEYLAFKKTAPRAA